MAKRGHWLRWYWRQMFSSALWARPVTHGFTADPTTLWIKNALSTARSDLRVAYHDPASVMSAFWPNWHTLTVNELTRWQFNRLVFGWLERQQDHTMTLRSTNWVNELPQRQFDWSTGGRDGSSMAGSVSFPQCAASLPHAFCDRRTTTTVVGDLTSKFVADLVQTSQN